MTSSCSTAQAHITMLVGSILNARNGWTSVFGHAVVVLTHLQVTIEHYLVGDGLFVLCRKVVFFSEVFS